MAWRRLGTIALQVTAASAAAAALRAREAAAEAPPDPAQKPRPVVFGRVAVISPPAESTACFSTSAAA